MNNLDSYKELWQKQKTNKVTDIDLETGIPNILYKLKKFEDKQFIINLVKTIIVAFILLTMIFFISEFNTGMFSITGIIVMSLSVVCFLFIYWKKQFSVSELNMNENSVSFLNYTIFRLSEQKKLFNTYFPFFGLGLIISINLFYLDLLETADIGTKLIFHTGITLFLIIAIFVGWKIRMYRIRKEWEPLINELTDIKNDLIKEE